MTTGVIFGLITLAHLARAVDEGARIMTDPWWVVLTALAIALCGWAGRLLWVARRDSSRPAG
jgi:hypothetical protein